MKYLAFVLLLISTPFTAFAVEPGKLIRKFEITYEEDDFRVPKGEIWKLSWKSPYKPFEVGPAYDVRVRGKGAFFGPDQKGQISQASHTDSAVFDVNAGKQPAEILLSPNTGFAIANDRIQVTVTVYAAP